MKIQKNGDLFGLAGGFHLRVSGSNDLRLASDMGSVTISSTDGQADYDRIIAAMKKGETFLDLDAAAAEAKKKAEAAAKHAAKKAESEASAEPAEDTAEGTDAPAETPAEQ